jgi:hypothetical protein
MITPIVVITLIRYVVSDLGIASSRPAIGIIAMMRFLGTAGEKKYHVKTAPK